MLSACLIFYHCHKYISRDCHFGDKFVMATVALFDKSPIKNVAYSASVCTVTSSFQYTLLFACRW